MLDGEEELVDRLLVAAHQLHRVVAVVQGVFPRVQQKCKSYLRQIVCSTTGFRARLDKVSCLGYFEVTRAVENQTCLAECLASTSWMEIKFFKLLDILHPAIVRWPEWRKYLEV